MECEIPKLKLREHEELVYSPVQINTMSIQKKENKKTKTSQTLKREKKKLLL